LGANEYLLEEKFPYADCVAIGNGAILRSHRIDCSNLTDVFQLFAADNDGSKYSGGEAAAHGSCGYFCKTTNGNLDWAIMALESSPFVQVKFEKHLVTFISSSGERWTIKDDDITLLKVA
jgi:hypothetical protein